MAIKKEHFRARIKTILQDDAEILHADELERFLDQAKRVYDSDKPREIIVDNSEPNGSDYDFDLPDNWVDGFSTIISKIEYPQKATDGYQQPQYVDDNDWIIYKTADATYLRFLTFSPASGYIFRYTYTVPHTLTDATCTIVIHDIDAVCDLASAYCFWALSAKYAQTEEPTIEADVIDYARKSDDYRMLAIQRLDSYKRHMGIGVEDEDIHPGGQAIKDFDIQYAWRENYLTHPKGYR